MNTYYLPNLGELSRVFAQAGPKSEYVLRRRLFAFGGAVLRGAKALIGHEDKLLPALSEATQDDRIRHGYSPRDTFLRSGSMRDSYEIEAGLSGPVPTVIVGSADMKAYWGEFGQAGGGWRGRGGPQPPRPVLGRAVHDVSKEQYALIALEVPGLAFGRPSRLLSAMTLANQTGSRSWGTPYQGVRRQTSPLHVSILGIGKR